MAAHSASSASSRLLPMPGSPDTNVTRPRPADASARWSSSVANSRSRPKHDIACRAPAGACGRRSQGRNAGSWTRIAASSRRTSGPGSTPSSSASTTRNRRHASNASPCRPSRYSAIMSCVHRRSRSGVSATSFSHSATASRRPPTARIAAIRSSAIDARSSSSPAASVRANGRSANSASAGPRQSASASSKVAIAAARSPRSASRRPSATSARAAAASVVSPSST